MGTDKRPEFIEEIKDIFRLTRFNLILTVVTFLGGGVVFFAVDKLDTLSTVVLACVILATICLLIITRGKSSADRLAMKEMESERDQLSHQLSEKALEDRDEAIQLLGKSVQYTRAVLRAMSQQIVFFAKASTHSPADSPTSHEMTGKAIAFSDSIIQDCLKSLSIMFEGTSRGVDKTTYPHNYFKSALFEKTVKDGNLYLNRIAYAYPSDMEPDPRTGLVETEKHPNAGHVNALKEDEIIIVHDVASETHCWEDLRPHQKDDYRSMICVPIVKGKRGTDHREVLAVLVIDTNREGYFVKDPHYKAFLGSLLGPFRTLLTTACDIRRASPS